MKPNGHGNVTVSLELISFSISHDDQPELRCKHCGEDLVLHQPDGQFPGRLLGVCPACRGWSVMDLMPDKDEAIMVLLPGNGYFRSALDGRE
jgi:hypothetical protein